MFVQWVKQLRKAGNKKPVILVATKTDVRNNPENSRHVTREGFFIITKARGMQMAEKIGVPYLECSSLFLEGVNDVFQRAILAALEDIGNQRNKKNKTSCCILQIDFCACFALSLSLHVNFRLIGSLIQIINFHSDLTK